MTPTALARTYERALRDARLSNRGIRRCRRALRIYQNIIEGAC